MCCIFEWTYFRCAVFFSLSCLYVWVYRFFKGAVYLNVHIFRYATYLSVHECAYFSDVLYICICTIIQSKWNINEAKYSKTKNFMSHNLCRFLCGIFHDHLFFWLLPLKTDTRHRAPIRLVPAEAPLLGYIAPIRLPSQIDFSRRRAHGGSP